MSEYVDFLSTPRSYCDEYKVLVSSNGRGLVVESGIKHRTGNIFKVISVYDTVGMEVFLETTNCSKEMKMASEVITLERNESGLPLVIRKNELGESLTHGILHTGLQNLYDDETQLVRFLNQEHVSLFWSYDGRLESVLSFALSHYFEGKEVFVPNSEVKFRYDNDGKIVRTTHLRYLKNGSFVDCVELYEHERIDEHTDKVIMLIYNRYKTEEDLTITIARGALYDSRTREGIAYGRYVNAVLVPKGSDNSEPLYILRPDYGNTLVLEKDDKTKGNEFLIKVAPEIKVPITVNIGEE